jgi:hypothetical protein
MVLSLANVVCCFVARDGGVGSIFASTSMSVHNSAVQRIDVPFMVCGSFQSQCTQPTRPKRVFAFVCVYVVLLVELVLFIIFDR